MTEIMNYQFLETPIGRLRLISNGQALLRVEFAGRHGSDGQEQDDPVLQQTKQQLVEYFEGRRKTFSVPLPGGSVRAVVWARLPTPEPSARSTKPGY